LRLLRLLRGAPFDGGAEGTSDGASVGFCVGSFVSF
jgi:hypothetical protein